MNITYSHGQSLIPATKTEDDVTGFRQVDAIPDLVVEEREALKNGRVHSIQHKLVEDLKKIM